MMTRKKLKRMTRRLKINLDDETKVLLGSFVFMTFILLILIIGKHFGVQ